MQREAIEHLVALLPAQPGVFDGSEFAAPVRSAILGGDDMDMADLRADLLAKQDADVKDLLAPLLLAAEAVEAAQPDKAGFFITDRAAQSLVFTGSKWRAGWALVLGGDQQQDLIQQLQQRSFMVFTDTPGLADTHFIGDRPTSPIYFAQLMVRYGMIWGRIAPGDDHELGHFLERDMPGLIIVCRDLPPLKYLVTLGLMKLGAPAVVPSTFPFHYGYRVVADTVDEILHRGGEFPNLRQRYFEDETISLPEPCNPAFLHEEIGVGQRLGGTAQSFFCLQPAGLELSEAPSGHTGADIGIVVSVNADGFSDDVAISVEKAALKAINYLPGIHAYDDDGVLHLDLAQGVDLDETQITEAIYWGIRLEYPRLKQIGVRILRDPAVLSDVSSAVRQYKARRQQLVEQMDEFNSDDFCACIECRTFSLVHTCLLTPGRAPMCGSRSYVSVKAGALFGSNQVPWQRPSEKNLAMRSVFKKGKLLDAVRGEYEGANHIYQDLTGGRLQRVFLHSVRDYPVTSCGCFQALAFWMPEVNGLGIMSRRSLATAPDGSTWEMLANRAGGKQTPGIAGISLQYMHSADFLKGDGGMGNVMWVDSALYEKSATLFAPGQKIATERDVRTMDDLRQFVGR